MQFSENMTNINQKKDHKIHTNRSSKAQNAQVMEVVTRQNEK